MIRLHLFFVISLGIALASSACQRVGADRVSLAVAGSAQAMGAALDITKVKARPGPVSWDASAWLRHDELAIHADWILTCPLAPGDPIAMACLRRPFEKSGLARVLALEGAERIWPGEYLRLFACDIQDAPVCMDSGRAVVLERLADVDQAGRVQLRLGLSPKQGAAVDVQSRSRFFVASPGADVSAGAVIVAWAALLDGKHLLRLHAERMERMRKTMEAWGRALGAEEMDEP